MNNLTASLVRHVGLSIVVATAGFATMACGSKNDDLGLGSDESALVEDSNETDEADGDTETGVEETLSGTTPTGEDPAPVVDEAAVAERARKNAGLHFQPAGCIVSTRDKNVVTHVFKDCTGPRGMVAFNGTVTSTWSKTATGFQVKHDSTGFKLNGATVTHSATIDYTKAGGVITRHRVVNSSGTTRNGKSITHTADYTTTYDKEGPTACITRDGSSMTTIGARSVQRSIKGFKRCGLLTNGCPMSGTLTLTRKPSGYTVSVNFPEQGKATITGPRGGSVTISLSCRAT